MRFKAGAGLVALWLLLASSSLQADAITSYTASNWIDTTVAGSFHDADFSTLQQTVYGPGGYTTPDGFVITGVNSDLQGVNWSGYPSLMTGNDPGAQLVVTTPSGGKTALLFLLASNPMANNYTITLSDGQMWTVPATTTFFGISVSHPIESATLSADNGARLILQNLTYGTSTLPLDSPVGGTGPDPVGSDDPTGDPSSVPEAATTFLLGGGLLLVALLSKRLSTPAV